MRVVIVSLVFAVITAAFQASAQNRRASPQPAPAADGVMDDIPPPAQLTCGGRDVCTTLQAQENNYRALRTELAALVARQSNASVRLVTLPPPRVVTPTRVLLMRRPPICAPEDEDCRCRLRHGILLPDFSGGLTCRVGRAIDRAFQRSHILVVGRSEATAARLEQLASSLPVAGEVWLCRFLAANPRANFVLPPGLDCATAVTRLNAAQVAAARPHVPAPSVP